MTKLGHQHDKKHHEGTACPCVQMPVLSGASGVEIASGLAAILGMEYVALESRRFPDGEAYVRILPIDRVSEIGECGSCFKYVP